MPDLEERIATIHTAIDDGGLDMVEELRSVLRWEEKRMGAVSRGVLKSVIGRLEKLSQGPDLHRGEQK